MCSIKQKASTTVSTLRPDYLLRFNTDTIYLTSVDSTSCLLANLQTRQRAGACLSDVDACLRAEGEYIQRLLYLWRVKAQ